MNPRNQKRAAKPSKSSTRVEPLDVEVFYDENAGQTVHVFCVSRKTCLALLTIATGLLGGQYYQSDSMVDEILGQMSDQLSVMQVDDRAQDVSLEAHEQRLKRLESQYDQNRD